MAKTTFRKRFNDLVAHLTNEQLGAILGVTADAARKARVGEIKSLKFEAGMRLAHELNVSPWDLAGLVQPARPHPAKGASGAEAHRALAQAQIETAEGAVLLAEELVEHRSRIRRLEAALAELQTHVGITSVL